MKKLLLALTALASIAGAAAPAAAQPFGSFVYPHYDGIDRREAADARRIEWCVRVGGMSWGEARELRFELRQIQMLEARMRFGGLSPVEYFILSRRLARLEAEINATCHPFHVGILEDGPRRVLGGPGPVEFDGRF